MPVTLIDKLIYNLVKFRKVYAVTAAMLLMLMLLFSGVPVIDSTLGGYNIDNNPYDSVAKRMTSLFGSENIIQVLVEPEPTNVKTFFTGMKEVEKEISKEFPGIRVESVNSAAILLYREVTEESPVKEMLTEALNIPLAESLVSRDTSSVMMVVLTYNADNFDVNLFDSIIGRKYPGIVSLSAISQLHIQKEIEDSIRRDYILLLPVILIFIAGFLLFSYRRLSALLFCIFNLGLSFVPVLFFLTVFHVSINQITSSVLPIAVILSLSSSVHLVTGFIHRSAETDLNIRVFRTLKHYLMPSFLSSLTTAIAFGSFVLSDSPYIRQFGIVTACSILIVFVLTFLIAPFSLRFVHRGDRHLLRLGFGSGIERLLIRYKKGISVTLISIMIASLFFVPGLKFQTNLEAFIPRNTPVYYNYQIIKKAFHSLAEIDLLIEANDNSPADDSTSNIRRDLIKVVSAMSEDIERYPETGSVQSIRDQIDFERQNRVFGFRTNLFSRKGNPFVSEDQEKYRVNIKLRNQKDIETVLNRLDNDFEKYEPGYKYSVYSEFLFFDYISSSVTRSLLRSLLFSALLIIIILLILSMNIKTTIVSIIANLVPLAFLVIIFSIFKIDVNITTSITLVICLGLIVDDTIHILYRRVRLAEPLEELGFGILTTSLLLTGGFLSFVLSQSRPNQIFGLLCAVVFLIAAISDMTIMSLYFSKQKSRN